MDKKLLTLKRKIYVNSKNGQPTITLPKKCFIKGVPKEVQLKVIKAYW
jgi:hypothetical protein